MTPRRVCHAEFISASRETLMLFKKLEKELQTIIIQKPKIILGLSGGPDSVFLFYFLNKLHQENKIELVAVNLDHEWRKESAQDTEFCKNLCEQNNIKFIGKKASELQLNLKFNGSMEDIGRKLRQHLFKQVLIEVNANYIALAHHMQDQQETFFWRIIRGTTLNGLTCMKYDEPPFIRPLLNIEKKEILDYLHKNNIKYVIDQSNDSDKYLRNRIRKYVIPQLEKVDPRFTQKFASTLKHLQDEEDFLNKLTQKTFDSIFKYSEKSKRYIGDLNAFIELDLVLQKRVLIYLLNKEKVKFNPSDSFLNELLRFLKNKNGGTHEISVGFSVFKKQNLFGIVQN